MQKRVQVMLVVMALLLLGVMGAGAQDTPLERL
jgi:hypothetical protein